MRFLHPSLLAWLALLAVPVVLYLFRRKPRDVRVSTLLFFKSLAREFQESAWLRWLKRLLSFLLSAAVIVFTAFALARLVVSPPAGSLKSVVILVDRSASMATRDEAGRTRLDDARAAVRERLAGLPGGVAVSFMAYDARPEILLPRSLDRCEVERALASVEPRPVEGDAASALALARRLASIETPAAVWHATDTATEVTESTENRAPSRSAGSWGHNTGPDGRDTVDDRALPRKSTERSRARIVSPGSSSAGRGERDVATHHIARPLDSPVNAGITAFQLRRLPMERGRLEAFVQVHYAGKEAAEVQLEMRIDGALVSLRSLTVGPRERERLLVPLAAGEGKALSLRAKLEGDCLPLDDEVHAVIPELRPVRVLWVSPEPGPFTALALGSMGGGDGEGTASGAAADVEVYRGGPEVWPPSEEIDVVIFQDWLPDEWPADVPVVALNPPGPLGPVMVAPLRSEGLPLEGVRATSDAHPLLYGVASARVALTQTAVVEAEGPLEPLWVGEAGAVLSAGEVKGQRVVVMAFDPERSERLPLMASYPLLMGNAVYWASRPASDAGPGDRPSADGANRRTGELARLDCGSITWWVPSAPSARSVHSGDGTREETVSVVGNWVEFDRVGLWRTDAGRTGSAALLSARETLLPAVPKEKAGAEGEVAARDEAGGFLRGDLAPVMMSLALAVLLVESFLFHRRAVY